MSSVDLPVLTAKDFASDQEIRWCPRCGDYSILAQMKKVVPTLGIPKEKFVFVSGIGCSSRFPYYMDTYGFHSIHGRAPAIATGIKVSRPDLSVWVITGDGDALSIGGNHLLHAIRRNMDLKIILFNNQIYGLTKGQYSPTSPVGQRTKSTPLGSIDQPLSPLSVAIGSEATFVARSVDVDIKHLTMVLERAAQHKGTAFVEVYQDCNVFNSGAFFYASKKGEKEDNTVYLEHGKPLIFGRNRDKGIRVNEGNRPEVVDLSNVSEDDLLFHDEKSDQPSLAFLLARMRHPEFPEPLGIFRAVDRPVYDEQVALQVDSAIDSQGEGDLDALFNSGDTWMVGDGEDSSPAAESEPIEEVTFDPLKKYDDVGTELEEAISSQGVGALHPKPPQTIDATTTVRDAIHTLVNRRIGCLLIEDEGRLSGIFTERDVLNKVATNTASMDCPISKVMTHAPATITNADSIGYALHTMDLGGYRHLPVVDDDGRPTGVISVRDIQRYLCDQFGELSTATVAANG